MLDIRLIRDNPMGVAEKLNKRLKDGFTEEIIKISKLDEQRRSLIPQIDDMKSERNTVSKSIPKLNKEGADTAPIFEEMRLLGEKINALSAELATIEENLADSMLRLPNIPDDDLASGGKESNEALRYFGEKPDFGFEIMDHVDICEKLGLIDYKRGVKLGGSGSWLYRGLGARLEWALLNFFIAEHLNDGYEFILPPHMLGWACGTTAGQFPKFSDDVFHIANPSSDEKFFLLPTAETALVNVHRDEIMEEDELPKKYIAYTPCYRREAGSYRSEERGMIRGHQFNKIEMVQYTTPENSDAAFNELVEKAERLVRQLGLHHRVSKLAAGDVSSGMARTYDIEVWIPSIGIYKEVSSASNARDYQARRGNIRYRDKSGQIRFAHTLNASGLATSRIFPALVEQYQNSDGSISVPEVLVPFMGGITKITG